eukprot:4061015-Alexandrium_andersonii.AAC.1
MSASLVGSEMCIRDRSTSSSRPSAAGTTTAQRPTSTTCSRPAGSSVPTPCLLYTSDAADDM